MNRESNNWQVPLQEEVQEPILPDGDSKSSITLSLGSDLGSHSSHNSGQGQIGDQVQGFGLQFDLNVEPQDDPNAAVEVEHHHVQHIVPLEAIEDHMQLDHPELQAHNDNLQVGMALVPAHDVDPGFADHICLVLAFSATSRVGNLAWNSFFKHVSENSSKLVSIPSHWVDFFTARLISLEDFSWAKGFLFCNIWKLIEDIQANCPSRDFELPSKCPFSQPPVCFLSTAVQDISQGFSTPQALAKRIEIDLIRASTSAMHVNKRKLKTIPTIESELRRSDRLKVPNRGFRDATCFDKNCLACAGVPSPLPGKVVKNLCHSFDIPEPSDNPVPEEDQMMAVAQVQQKKGENLSAAQVKKAGPKKKDALKRPGP